jgi:hypothetical protein
MTSQCIKMGRANIIMDGAGESRIWFTKKTVLHKQASHPSDEPTNKRLHIQFFHSGVISSFINPGKKDAIEHVLNYIWAQFGEVTDVFYDTEFACALISFATHELAASAMEGLNDGIRFRAVLQALDASQTDPNTKAWFAKITVQLFQPNTERGGQLLKATWAPICCPGSVGGIDSSMMQDATEGDTWVRVAQDVSLPRLGRQNT